MQGPDFPTGGLIIGRSGILSAYHKGRGSILMRARVEVEQIRKDREALIVSAIPYQINKKTLIEKIADLVREKRVEGIADIWDETNREGMRIVIELKRDAVADVVLNQLYRFSDLQTTFGANMLAINGGRPESLNLKDMVEAFTHFREEVVSRRTKFLLNKARDRAHVLVGLAIAVANIDEVIKLIRHAPSPAAARDAADGAQLAGARYRAAHRADRRSAPQGAARRHLQAVRGAGEGHPRVAPCPPHGAGPRRDRRRAEEDRRGDQGVPRHPRLAPAHRRDRQGRADRHQERVRHAAQNRNPRDGRRRRGRGPHPARGLRRHRLAQGLHQARAAGDLSRAAARRQGPLGLPGRAKRTSSPRCSSPRRTRRCCSSPRAACATA